VNGRLASIDRLGAGFRVPGLLALLARGERLSAPPWPRGGW
jgi:hypothetical protein